MPLIQLQSANSGMELFSILRQSLQHLQRFEIHKPTCATLQDRCSFILATVDPRKHSPRNPDALTTICHRLKEWATLDRVQGFLKRDEVARDLQRLTHELDLEFPRTNSTEQEEILLKERERAHIRALLLTIITNKDDFTSVLALHPHLIEHIMRQVQEQIQTGPTTSRQHKVFLDSLWKLSSESHIPPPIADVSKEITTLPIIGRFPDIFHSEWLGQKPVTLKKVAKLTTENALQRFRSEVEGWRKLNHPHVACLYGFACLQEYVYTVSSCMDGPSSLSFLQQNPKADRIKLLAETAAGLEYLHQHRVVHGDLRAANIIVSKTGLACIINFGISKFVEEIGCRVTNDSSRWQAIEILDPKLVSRNTRCSTLRSDVWSFGMFALEIMTGCSPFSHIQSTAQVVHDLLRGLRPTKPSDPLVIERGLKDSLWDVLRQCWLDDPERRPTMASVARLIKGDPVTFPIITSKYPPQSSASSLSSSLDLPISFSSSSPPSFGDICTPSSDDHVPISPSDYLPPRSGGLFGLGKRFSLYGKPPSSLLYKLAPRKSSIDKRVSTSDSKINLSVSPQRPQTSSGPAQSNPIDHADRPPMPNPLRQEPLDGHSNPPRPYLRRPSKSLDNSSTHPRLTPQEASLEKSKSLCLSEDGSVVSGTLDSLVERVLTTNSESPDKDTPFRDTFLQMYQCFASAQDLMHLMIDRFNTPSMPMDHWIATRRSILSFFTAWLEKETLDPSLLVALCDFAKSVQGPPILITCARTLFKAGTHALQPTPRPATSPTSTILPKPAEITPSAIARQLVTLQNDYLHKIRPADFIMVLKEVEGRNKITSFNVLNNMVLLVLWVTKTVLSVREPSAQKRAKKLKFFLSVAHECRLLRDFSSMAAIIIGIDSVAISRLVYTMELVDQTSRRHLEEMKELLKPSRNFLAYRNELKSSEKPWTPFLMVHIMDIKIHYAACKRPIEVDGQMHINFAGHQKLLEKIHAVFPGADNQYNLEKHPQVLSWIQMQIRGIPLTKEFEQQLEAKSIEAATEEERYHLAHTIERELDRSGFY